MKKLGTCIVISFLLFILSGCADSGRRLAMSDSCIIMHNVTIFVDKTGNTESPSSTPNLDLSIPFIPVP